VASTTRCASRSGEEGRAGCGGVRNVHAHTGRLLRNVMVAAWLARRLAAHMQAANAGLPVA
jgi:hypothetical protein